MEKYIFLDPDSSLDVDFGLLVVVAAPTGIVYAQQSGGAQCSIREIEGFAVPLGGQSAAEKLVSFFARFKGYPPAYPSTTRYVAQPWKPEEVRELQGIVEKIPFWKTKRSDNQCVVDDEPAFLQLDLERMDQLTEGWIPVKTVYGCGVLMFHNSD